MSRDRQAELEGMCLIDLRSLVRQYGLVMIAEQLTNILAQQSDLLILADMLDDIVGERSYR